MTLAISVDFPLPGISTHTLTWSVTPPIMRKNASRAISTHTLTWSVTPDTHRTYVRHQYFNSHAHVERDLVRFFGQYIKRVISTHTLTWSVTVYVYMAVNNSRDFNSHAHVERDHLLTLLDKYHSHFNSHAHVERDDL